MNVLQLCPRVPFPPTDGGAIAMYDVAAGLVRAGHTVTLLAANTPKHRQAADALAHLGPSLRLVTVDVDTALSPLKALRNLLFSPHPYNVERFMSEALAAKLAELLTTEPFDVVQMEGTFVAWYVDVVRRVAPGVPTVLRAHNVEHEIWDQLARNERQGLKAGYLRHLARRLKRFEAQYLPRFSAVAAITEPDQRRLRQLGCQEPVVFIPAGVDLTRVQPDPGIKAQPKTLFFLGSLDWRPNQEGLEWFLQHVWPEARRNHPELVLHVAGKNMPDHIRDLRVPGVQVHGFVESAPVFMQQYEVMIVPLLSGGGMRVKIIEGMALGKCIISTGLGSEGIAVRHLHDILVCDDPQQWIEVLRQYCHGEFCYKGVGEQAQRTARLLYDNDKVVQRFVELYRRVGAGEAVALPPR
ncbi:glycosyltransferase family 4 protein [Hymenobacter sp. 15J16-1T3B]|uniref:glycosyltransferase family 4 protein n=1 Tax=Hymenobacter sp. 15J16-1T3B TaxID=2886941 RepID=UPI001D10EA89|nr:glycosyltransferase family 4 protein [Hymenobacter sp. 15J16-1T3B]MCC3156994.1 glycosyltransferase family 4 protein [Hymenobacter sp. 15J16-1T3B]